MKLTRSIEPSWRLFGLVPFINVIFLVLVFFTLSSRFIIQPGVVVSVPFSPFRLAPQRNTSIVSITSGAAPGIYFQDEKVTLSQLTVRLGAMRSRQQSLVIRADRQVPYETVVAVMNEGVKAGFSVVLAGNETPP